MGKRGTEKAEVIGKGKASYIFNLLIFYSSNQFYLLYSCIQQIYLFSAKSYANPELTLVLNLDDKEK